MNDMKQDFDEMKNVMHAINQINQQIKDLENKRDILKQQLEEGVKIYGGKIGFDDVGSAYMVKGKTRVSYDAPSIDALIVQLIQDGEVHTAQKLSDLRKESQGSDYLVVKKN